MDLRETVFESPRADSTLLTSGGGLGLPAELLVPARRRLSWIAVVFATVSGLGFFVTISFDNLLLEAVQITGMVAGVAMAWIARRSPLPHHTVLKLGLFFLVFNCLIDSVAVPFFIYREAGYVPVLTWTSIYIAVYPLAIPSPPLRTLAISLAAAAMVPLGLGTLAFLGALEASALQILASTVNPLFCVGIATLGAKVIHGINRDYARAKALGSYRLEERLGAGGMGEVWRATHSLLARPAAIKLIQPDMIADRTAPVSFDIKDRFAREAKATATLRSPHTVELWDFGITPEGDFYYVMELLEGMDLATLVADHGPQPPERVAHILVQVCASLEEAHGNGLVHRDIKPANIFLCRFASEEDFVKVLDFGLVTVAAGSSVKTNPRGGGSLRGTPAYMAPELVENPDSVDGRADLYMLGGVAYKLLTGHRPFERDNTMATLMAHLSEELTPPSYWQPDIPDALETIVVTSLKKDREQRPASATDLAAQLHATELPQAWNRDRARQWRRQVRAGSA